MFTSLREEGFTFGQRVIIYCQVVPLELKEMIKFLALLIIQVTG